MYKVIMLPTAGAHELERPAITLAVRLAQKLDAELRLVRAEAAPVALDTVARKNPLTITEKDWR